MSSETRHHDFLRELRDTLRAFADERDWDQFHTPTNLAMALSVEVGELLEHFQWNSGTSPASFTAAQLDDIAQELADVLIYLVRLADKLGVDLRDAAIRKIAINAAKYPVEKARGSSRKYSDPD
jgi:NTP pyrophosphatase (non-canonical NTP hydrolase)